MRLIRLGMVLSGIMLTGCSSTHTEEKTETKVDLTLESKTKAPAKSPLSKLSSADYRKMHKHVFESQQTFPFNPKDRINHDPKATIELEHGILNESAKQLVKTVWDKLEAKGFSGYDPTVLNQKNVRYDFVHGKAEGISDNTPFHSRFLGVLLNDRPGVHVLSEDKTVMSYPFLSALHGLKRATKTVHVMSTATVNDTKLYEVIVMDPQSFDAVVRTSRSTLKEWNDVFMDVLQADAFFQNLFNPKMTDLSSTVGTRRTRRKVSKIDTRQFNLNGVSGDTLPIPPGFTLHLSGYLHNKNADIKGLCATRFGNTSVGLIYAYSNVFPRVLGDASQLELSAMVSRSFGPMFVEAQWGRSSLNSPVFQGVLGARTQLTVGLDTEYMSPFLQVLNPSFDAGITPFLGLEMDITLGANSHEKFALTAQFKVGYTPQDQRAIGGLSLTGKLDLDPGVNLAVELNMFSEKSSFAISTGFTR